MKYLLFLLLNRFQRKHGIWADNTFGKRSPLPTLYHLKKEVQELIESPNDLTEYADVFLLLMDSSRNAGFKMTDVLSAAKVKFDQNKKRNWGIPDENGVVEHIREEQ